MCIRKRVFALFLSRREGRRCPRLRLQSISHVHLYSYACRRWNKKHTITSRKLHQLLITHLIILLQKGDGLLWYFSTFEGSTTQHQIRCLVYKKSYRISTDTNGLIQAVETFLRVWDQTRRRPGVPSLRKVIFHLFTQFNFLEYYTSENILSVRNLDVPVSSGMKFPE